MYICEILENNHAVTKAEVEKALQFQKKFGGKIGSILINMGVISEEDLLDALALQLGLPRLSAEIITTLIYDKEKISQQINLDFLLHHHWLPVIDTTGEIAMVTLDPLNYEVQQYLLQLTSQPLIYLAKEYDFREIEKECRQTYVSSDENELLDFELDEHEVGKFREMAA